MENQTIDSTTSSSTNPHVPKATPSATKRYLILLITTLVVAGCLIFYFYKTLNPIAIDTVIDELAPTPLSGSLILTATLDGLPAVFTLDLETEDALFLKYPSDYDVTAFPEFTDKINSEKVFFVSSIIDAEPETDKLGLSSWIVGVEGVQYYSSASGTVERDLNWSEAANKLAFYRVKASAEIPVGTVPAIDDLEIVIIDPDQNIVTAVIDGGIYPRWSPTGETLLFLKKDGIYEFNLATKQANKIQGPEDPNVVLTPAEMLDVSRDGSKLVITSQGVGSITMFDISSWNPLTLKINHTYTDKVRRYSEPLFSPDGTKYALLTIDAKLGEDRFFEPRLEIRDANTAEVLYSRLVETFDMTQFYISDWIAESIVAGGEGISNDNAAATSTTE